MRIGLTQRVEVIGSRRERRDCLDQAWTDLLQSFGFIPVPLPNRIANVNTLIFELGLGGVILTGGNDLSHLPEAVNPAPERDRLEYEILDICAEFNLPVLGVCRGMQVMVSHGGGTLKKVDRHVQTLHPIKVCATEGFPLTYRREVNSYHRFGVTKENISAPWRVVATSEDGVVEAVAHGLLPRWGIMWHPERPPGDPQDARIFDAIFRKGKI